MPNTRGGIRRSASSSNRYGTTEDSRPMAAPVASTPGRSSAACPAATACGVTTRAATIIAMASPDEPLSRRPVDALSMM